MNQREAGTHHSDAPFSLLQKRSPPQEGGDKEEGNNIANRVRKPSFSLYDPAGGGKELKSPLMGTESGNTMTPQRTTMPGLPGGGGEQSSDSRRTLELLRPAIPSAGVRNAPIAHRLSLPIIVQSPMKPMSLLPPPPPAPSPSLPTSPFPVSSAASSVTGNGSPATTTGPGTTAGPTQYKGVVKLRDRLEARHQQALCHFQQLIAELNQKADEEQRERLSRLQTQLEESHHETERTLLREAARIAGHREYLEAFGRSHLEAIASSSSTSSTSSSVGATFSAVFPALVDEYHKVDETDFAPARHRMEAERCRLLGVIEWLRTVFQRRQQLITSTAAALELEEAKRRETIENALRQLMEQLAKTTFCSITGAHVLAQRVIHHINEQISTNYSATKSLQSRLLSRETLKLSVYQQRAAQLYTEAREVMAMSAVWWLRSTLQSPPLRRPHSRMEVVENIRKVAVGTQREVRHFLESLSVTCQTLREERQWKTQEGEDADTSLCVSRLPALPVAGIGEGVRRNESSSSSVLTVPPLARLDPCAASPSDLLSSSPTPRTTTMIGSSGLYETGKERERGWSIPTMLTTGAPTAITAASGDSDALGGPSSHPLQQRLGGSSAAGWLRHYQSDLWSDPFPPTFTEVVDEWRMKAIVVIRNGLASIVSLADALEAEERRRVAAAEVLCEGLSKELDWIFRPLPMAPLETKPKKRKLKKKTNGGANTSAGEEGDKESRKKKDREDEMGLPSWKAASLPTAPSFNGTLTPKTAGKKKKATSHPKRSSHERSEGHAEENSRSSSASSSADTSTSSSPSTSGSAWMQGNKSSTSSGERTVAGGMALMLASSRSSLGKTLRHHGGGGVGPIRSPRRTSDHRSSSERSGGSGGSTRKAEEGEREDSAGGVRHGPAYTSPSTRVSPSVNGEVGSGGPSPLPSFHRLCVSEEQAFCLRGSFSPDVLDPPFEPLLEPDMQRWNAFDQAGQQLARPALGFLIEECRWFSEAVRSGLLSSHQCLEETILTSFKSVMRQFEKATESLVAAVRGTLGVARNLFQKQDEHHKDYEEKLAFLEEDFEQISSKLSHAVSKKLATELFQDGLECLDVISNTYLTYHHAFLGELEEMKEKVERHSQEVYLRLVEKLGVEQVQDTVVRLQREYTDKAAMWLGKWIQEQLPGSTSSGMHKKALLGGNASATANNALAPGNPGAGSLAASAMSNMAGGTSHHGNHHGNGMSNSGASPATGGGGKKGGGATTDGSRRPLSSPTGAVAASRTSPAGTGTSNATSGATDPPDTLVPPSAYTLFLSAVGNVPVPPGFGTVTLLETVQGLLAASQAAAATVNATAAAGGGTTAGGGGGGAIGSSPGSSAVLLFAVAQMILEGTRDPLLTSCRSALAPAQAQQLFQMESDLAKDIPVSYPLLHTLPSTSRITPPRRYAPLRLRSGSMPWAGSTSHVSPPPQGFTSGTGHTFAPRFSKDIGAGNASTLHAMNGGKEGGRSSLLVTGGGGGGGLLLDRGRGPTSSTGALSATPVPRRQSSLSFLNLPLYNASRAIPGLPPPDVFHAGDQAGGYPILPPLLTEEGLAYHVIHPSTFIEDPPAMSTFFSVATGRGNTGEHGGPSGSAAASKPGTSNAKRGRSKTGSKGEGGTTQGSGGEGSTSADGTGGGHDRRHRNAQGSAPSSPKRSAVAASGGDLISGVISIHSASGAGQPRLGAGSGVWGSRAGSMGTGLLGSLNASNIAWGTPSSSIGFTGMSSNMMNTNTGVGGGTNNSSKMKKGSPEEEEEDGGTSSARRGSLMNNTVLQGSNTVVTGGLGQVLLDAVAAASVIATVFPAASSSPTPRQVGITVDQSFISSYQPFFEDTIANPEKCFFNPMSLHLCLDTLRYEILNWALLLYHHTVESTRDYVEKSTMKSDIRLNHLLRHHRRRPATFQAEVFEARVRGLENKTVQSDKYCARLLDRMQKWENTLQLLRQDPVQEKQDQQTLKELVELEKKVVEATSRHVLQVLERRCAACREHYIEGYEAQTRKILEAAAKQRELMESDVVHYLSERERQLATEAYGERTLEEAVAKDALSIRVRRIADQMRVTMESMNAFSEEELASRKLKMEQYAQSFAELHQRSMAELQLGQRIQEVLSRVKITMQSVIQRSRSEEEKVSNMVKQVEAILLPGRGEDTGTKEEEKKSPSPISPSTKGELSGGLWSRSSRTVMDASLNPMAGLDALIRRLFSSSFLEGEMTSEEEAEDGGVERMPGTRKRIKSSYGAVADKSNRSSPLPSSRVGGVSSGSPSSRDRRSREARIGGIDRPSERMEGGSSEKRQQGGQGRGSGGGRARDGVDATSEEGEEGHLLSASERKRRGHGAAGGRRMGGGTRLRGTAAVGGAGGSASSSFSSSASSSSISLACRSSLMQGSVPPPLLPFSSSSSTALHTGAKEAPRGMKKSGGGGGGDGMAATNSTLSPSLAASSWGGGGGGEVVTTGGGGGGTASHGAPSLLAPTPQSPLSMALRCGLDLHHTTSGIGELPQEVEEVLLEELEEKQRLVQVQYQRLLHSSPASTLFHLLDELRPLLYVRGKSLHALQWAVEMIRLTPAHYIEPRPAWCVREGVAGVGGGGPGGGGDGVGGAAGLVGGVGNAVNPGMGLAGGAGSGGGGAHKAGGAGVPAGWATTAAGGSGGGPGSTASGGGNAKRRGGRGGSGGAGGRGGGAGGSSGSGSGSGVLHYNSAVTYDPLPAVAVMEVAVRRAIHVAKKEILELLSSHLRRYPSSLLHPSPVLLKAVEEKELYAAVDTLLAAPLQRFREYHKAAILTFHEYVQRLYVALQHAPQFLTSGLLQLSVTTLRQRLKCFMGSYVAFYRHSAALREYHRRLVKVALASQCHRAQLEHLDALERVRQEKTVAITTSMWGTVVKEIQEEVGRHGARCLHTTQNFFYLLKGLTSPSHLIPCEVSLVVGYHRGLQHHLRRQHREGSFREGGVAEGNSGGGGGTGGGTASTLAGGGSAGGAGGSSAAGHGPGSAGTGHRLPESVPVFKPDGRPPHASQLAMENAVQIAIQFTAGPSPGSSSSGGGGSLAAGGTPNPTGSGAGAGVSFAGAAAGTGSGKGGAGRNSVESPGSSGGATRGTGANSSSGVHPGSPMQSNPAAASSAVAAALATAAVQAGSASIVIPVPQYAEMECPGLPVYAFQPLHYFASRHPSQWAMLLLPPPLGARLYYPLPQDEMVWKSLMCGGGGGTGGVGSGGTATAGLHPGVGMSGSANTSTASSVMPTTSTITSGGGGGGLNTVAMGNSTGTLATMGGAGSGSGGTSGGGGMEMGALLPGGSHAMATVGTPTSSTPNTTTTTTFPGGVPSGNPNASHHPNIMSLVELWTSTLIMHRDTLSPSFLAPLTQLHQQCMLFAQEALSTLTRASEKASTEANKAFQSVEDREAQWAAAWQRTTARLVAAHASQPPGWCTGGAALGTATTTTSGGMTSAHHAAGEEEIGGGPHTAGVGGGGTGKHATASSGVASTTTTAAATAASTTASGVPTTTTN